MNTHRKLNYFSTQNYKSEDFLQIFGMWIVEEISEKSVKFRQKLVKFQHESAQTLNNFDDAVWKFVKNHKNSWRKFAEILSIEVWAVQKYVNLVDLVKSFPTSIYLQKSASIQPRTSLSKFGGKFNSLFIRLINDDPKEGWRWSASANSTRLVRGCIDADFCK